MRMRMRQGIVVTGVVIDTLLLGSARNARADVAVPNLLTDQGRLFDTSGNPVNGMQPFVFSFYTQAQGGTALWTETQNVLLFSGYFATQIGSVTSIPTGFFDAEAKAGATVYLGVRIGTDAEITPRQPLLSVPYARVANNAIGDITPNSVSVGGATVIDNTGKWVGPTLGLVGATGPIGPTGPSGAQGMTGTSGAIGPTGPQGAQGPQGPAGSTGSQGPAGSTGSQGPQGPTGSSGSQGTQGLTGSQGVQGPQGAQGPQGPAGAGIDINNCNTILCDAENLGENNFECFCPDGTIMLSGAANGFYESTPLFENGGFGFSCSNPLPSELNIPQSITLICC